jgi:hypothetical protein
MAGEYREINATPPSSRDQVAGSTPWAFKKGVDPGTKCRDDDREKSAYPANRERHQ